jgi:hypothetical protein
MITGDDLVRGVTCPRCKRESVVYNGNYFCEHTGCGWAMSERARGRAKVVHDKIVKTYLLQRRAEGEARGDQRTVDRMDFYLRDLEGVDVDRS